MTKENYSTYRNYLSSEDLLEETRPILEGIDIWWKNNTTDPLIEDITNITFSNENVKAKDRDYLRDVFVTLARIDNRESVVPLLEKFRRNKLLGRIAVAAHDGTYGRKGAVDEVLRLVQQLEVATEAPKDLFVTDDLDDILDSTVLTPGLRWRLDTLNKALGSLRKGDFGFIFARPETGKTTLIADQATFMAGQLKPEDGPILWFNNEEQGKKVRLRTYEAALAKSVLELTNNREQAKHDYQQKINGKLRIYDSASITKSEVERICLEHKPSLVIFDQIDKIKGFDADRDDLRLGAIYQWARELAKTYSPVIGTCQADGTAEGEKWLHMGHVSNAKTAKQAEADFIIGVGKTHIPGYEKIRYINISKNKLVGDTDSDPQMRHGQIEVLIQPQIARYEDIV